MITDDKLKQIRELSEQGRTVKEISQQLNISENTVRKYKKTPAPPTQEADDNTEATLSTSDYTTSDSDLSSTKGDNIKARHFTFVVYPSEAWVREHYPDCKYDGADGWGTAPDDWIEQLQNTCLPFAVSPLHYLDLNPDGTVKKPHWHAIVSWGNTTTLRHARVLGKTIMNSPSPQVLHSVLGAYKYLTHKGNPEKYQYEEEPTTYNNFEVPADNARIREIKDELFNTILLTGCTEYARLLAICKKRGKEYVDVAESHTFLYRSICASYRGDPLACLCEALDLFEGEEREIIADRIKRMKGVVTNENKSDD